MFEYDNEEGHLSRCSNKSKEGDNGEIPVQETERAVQESEKGQKRKKCAMNRTSSWWPRWHNLG